MVRFNLRRRIERGVLILSHCINCFWEKVLMSFLGKPSRYRMLPRSTLASPSPSVVESGCSASSGNVMTAVCHHRNHHHHQLDSDNLVALKISLLGDCRTGKTSFWERYVGNDNERGGSQSEGLNVMDKTLSVRRARISYSIWEVAGGDKYQDHLPVSCKDSIAILLCLMEQCHKMVSTSKKMESGTKLDDFIQLPIDLQRTIARQ